MTNTDQAIPMSSIAATADAGLATPRVAIARGESFGEAASASMSLARPGSDAVQDTSELTSVLVAACGAIGTVGILMSLGMSDGGHRRLIVALAVLLVAASMNRLQGAER